MADGSRFEAAYQVGDAPWDIGGPQPEVVALAEEGEIVGDVLDLGCGTGENALYLASLGRRVLGVDAAPTAIARAREKAAARGLPAAFLVADALDLGRLRRRFETVLDCGLFHTFDPEQRRPYAESLCEVLSPGGTLHLLCFSDLSPDLHRPAERGWGGGEEPPGSGPRRIAQHELGDAFRGIFVTTRLRAGRFASTLHPGGARAWVATLTRI
jgi:SAM-dependent methyltransferase